MLKTSSICLHQLVTREGVLHSKPSRAPLSLVEFHRNLPPNTSSFKKQSVRPLPPFRFTIALLRSVGSINTYGDSGMDHFALNRF
mmetsp:Transcript_46212/g.53525  ORF Transcript_46212/g.53525 Transcript_46212/m.53525 type:complete len:85 (-) Transcript_46212:157-411(-)